MSWLSELFSGGSKQTITPPNPAALAAFYNDMETSDPASYAQFGPTYDPNYASKQAAKNAASIAASTPAPSPFAPASSPGGPTPLAAGYANELIPSSFASPFVDSSIAKSREEADAFINNMLKRGTTTASGADAARASLTSQDPNVRSQIENISNTLLEQGRSGLGSYGPAGDLAGATAAAQAFQGGFGGALSGAVPAGLYNTADLTGASGAVSGPRNVSYDPYASEGGLKTGLTDPEAKVPGTKKRTTAVF